MPKAVCDYAVTSGNTIICRITEQLCGNVKYCRAEQCWKLSDNAINCPVPKRRKEK